MSGLSFEWSPQTTANESRLVTARSEGSEGDGLPSRCIETPFKMAIRFRSHTLVGRQALLTGIPEDNTWTLRKLKWPSLNRPAVSR